MRSRVSCALKVTNQFCYKLEVPQIVEKMLHYITVTYMVHSWLRFSLSGASKKTLTIQALGSV